MKKINQKNISFKRFFLLIILPILFFSFLVVLIKMIKDGGDFNPILLILVTLFGAIIGLMGAFPFLLIFSLSMETIYLLGFLKNRWLIFLYGGSIGIFTFWISTVETIWSVKKNPSLKSIKVFIIMFFIHAFVSLFIYRNNKTFTDTEKEKNIS